MKGRRRTRGKPIRREKLFDDKGTDGERGEIEKREKREGGS